MTVGVMRDCNPKDRQIDKQWSTTEGVMSVLRITVSHYFYSRRPVLVYLFVLRITVFHYPLSRRPLLVYLSVLMITVSH
jgi:hypothetical protein